MSYPSEAYATTIYPLFAKGSSGFTLRPEIYIPRNTKRALPVCPPKQPRAWYHESTILHKIINHAPNLVYAYTHTLKGSLSPILRWLLTTHNKTSSITKTSPLDYYCNHTQTTNTTPETPLLRKAAILIGQFYLPPMQEFHHEPPFIVQQIIRKGNQLYSSGITACIPLSSYFLAKVHQIKNLILTHNPYNYTTLPLIKPMWPCHTNHPHNASNHEDPLGYYHHKPTNPESDPTTNPYGPYFPSFNGNFTYVYLDYPGMHQIKDPHAKVSHEN